MIAVKRILFIPTWKKRDSYNEHSLKGSPSVSSFVVTYDEKAK
jgi:hypothetical protein